MGVEALTTGAGAGVGMDRLGTILQSIQAMQPPVTPVPATTFPDVPRSINPALSQMILQMLQQGTQGTQRIPSLGSLLKGG